MSTLDRLQRRGLGNEMDQDLIDDALQSAERARTLVQHLLAFARRQPLQATAVDMDPLVRGMADLVRSTIGPQIHVRVTTDPDLLPALADANQIEMAILNLAINARDAMPEGSRLRISALNETVGTDHPSGAAPGSYVRLSVSHTGTGMDEQTLRRAVEPFFSTTGVGRGTGLGLSMVHGLAAQLGGAFALRSELGTGTTVDPWLPVTERQPVAQVPGTDLADVPDGAQAGTILLVDDDRLVRSSVVITQGDLGYEVTEAASATEALRLVDTGLTPDLLVTDHLMPGMTGTDLVRALRDRHPGLPALVLGGYADMSGVAAHLPRLMKPFRTADLVRKVAEVMAG